MTAEIGRVLGGRYRLVAPIGMGASAQVYLADDVRLRRRVALKMLHDALAGDAEFLRRFRAEARAAAALSHPNVMAVYDWGDDEVAFIVTEYLGGGSLRTLLDKGELLSPSQALAVGLEATRALDYAHRRGFVHRDIKPANLLFGEEQRLRIADFGLARALAEAAWTEPQGAMLGTARYASPEQAKGEKLNGKADVYSLALVLVEAVTGEVPFAADTTLGTLMARVDKQLEVPDALGPLQGILTRAGHPDPEQRIDARALAAGLLRAAKALPKPAALPLAGALLRDGQLVVDNDPTVHGPAGASVGAPAAAPNLTPDDLGLDPPDWVNRAEPAIGTTGEVNAVAATEALADSPGQSSATVVPGAFPDGAGTGDAAVSPANRERHDDTSTGETVPVIDLRDGSPGAGAPNDLVGPAWADSPDPHPKPVDRVVDPNAKVTVPSSDRALVGAGRALGSTTPATVPLDVPYELEGEADGPRPRRPRWPWLLALVLLLIGGGGAAVINRSSGPAERVVVLPVPNLAGRTEKAAQAVATAAGWKTTVVTERRDGSVRGEVLTTVPAPGTRLKPGLSIELMVSAGQTEVAVPAELVGKPLPDVTAVLATVGLKVATAETRFDEKIGEGSVIAVADGTPAKLEKGTALPLVVSKGPEPRTVPSGLVGNTQKGATDALAALQLKVAVNGQFSDSVPEGQVMAQSPKPGEKVARDSTVTLEVSRGPELVAVPDVRSAGTPAQAAAILRKAGLKPGSVSGSSEGKPVGTTPGRGTKVKKGSTVNIVLG